MGRDCGDLEIGLGERAAIERLDVLEHVVDVAAIDRGEAGVEAVEHVGVIGVRAVAEAQRPQGGGGGSRHDARRRPRPAA